MAAETWTIENFAGTGKAGFSGDGGPATLAELNNPFGVVRGPDGAIWFCEYTGQRVRRISSDGKIETIAGSGAKGYEGDGGPALEASFNLPHELRFDRQGDLYIVDMGNHAVRKVDLRTRQISTIAGNGKPGYRGDGGPAKLAQFDKPHSIQFGPDGNLYVCDIGNHVIRCIDTSTQTIRTYAGTGQAGETRDGAAIRGNPLRGPRSIDFDRDGHMLLATREGNQVFLLDRQRQTIHHLAGTGQKGMAGHGGPAKQALLNGPKGIAVDREGNIWLADTESHTVRRIHRASGVLELMAGTGQAGDGPVGDPLACQLARLHGIYADADGSIFIGDSESHRIRVMRRVQP